MRITLANKYRPKEFSDVVSQGSIVDILEKQVMTNTFKNVYLFTGGAGTGKTTLARILANKINKREGAYNEIDAASNGGKDAVLKIVSDAWVKSLDSEYKIYIIDECHSISTEGWITFLKTIEEPPAKTIFIFCTTDVQKISAPILSRMQRFNLQRIPQDLMVRRLKYICEKEFFTNYELGVEYIAKIADGGMRDAITMLEKVSSLSTDISIENVVNILGTVNYKYMFDLTNHIIDMKELDALNLINEIHSSGVDLKLFINDYLSFVLDVNKYLLSNSYDHIKIPQTYDTSLKTILGLQDPREFYGLLMERLITIKESLRWETQVKANVELHIIRLCRG